MPKLTDTQLIILSTAGQRDDGTVLPLPRSLKLQGGAVNHVLKSLLKKGLLDEQPAGNHLLVAHSQFLRLRCCRFAFARPALSRAVACAQLAIFGLIPGGELSAFAIEPPRFEHGGTPVWSKN
jgi:hypothetical protein